VVFVAVGWIVAVLVLVAVAVGNGVDVAGSGTAGGYRLTAGIISLRILALSQLSWATALE
jgi:hypothetical protein